MKMLIVCFVAFLALSASAQDVCNQWTSCSTCTTQGSCGWCTYSGTCESGNQTGSFVGCTSPNWIWTNSYCPATPAPTSNCAAATTCYQCTSQGPCGWCSFNNLCEAGNQSGSFQGCVAPYWSWTNNQCATPAPFTPAPVACYQWNYNCVTCASQGGCGFCLATNMCEPGTSTGSSSGDCSGTSWAWTNQQCSATPAPPTPAPVQCYQWNYNCNTCAQQGGCGYCLSTNLCEPGTSSGSYTGDCSGTNWAWSYTQCSAVTPVPPTPTSSTCGDYMNDCIGCTEQGSCGYCRSTNQCEAGTGTGSNSGDCSGANWVWYNVQCNNSTKGKK